MSYEELRRRSRREALTLIAGFMFLWPAFFVLSYAVSYEQEVEEEPKPIVLKSEPRVFYMGLT